MRILGGAALAVMVAVGSALWGIWFFVGCLLIAGVLFMVAEFINAIEVPSDHDRGVEAGPDD